MTPNETRELARRFIRVWTPGHMELLEELATPDIVVTYPHFSEPVLGREAFREGLRETFRHFPDLKIETRAVLGGEGQAAVEWVYHATHQEGEMFGVEPRGTEVRVPGVTVYEIRQGLVAEERGVADVAGLMRQLGAL